MQNKFDDVNEELLGDLLMNIDETNALKTQN